MIEDKVSFWSTLPGLVTAVGGLVTAMAGLIGALYSAGLFGRKGKGEAGDKPKAAAGNESPKAVASNPESPRPVQLRSASATLTWEKVDAMLVKHGLFDKARNSSAAGIAHRYKAQAEAQTVVILDDATGLVWQKGGSAPSTFDDAGKFVDSLNAARHAGFADWRVPTLEEAMSLLTPAVAQSMHIDSVFSSGIPFIWTADQHADERAFMVYFYDGFAALESRQFNAHVRAVRSIA